MEPILPISSDRSVPPVDLQRLTPREREEQRRERERRRRQRRPQDASERGDQPPEAPRPGIDVRV